MKISYKIVHSPEVWSSFRYYFVRKMADKLRLAIGIMGNATSLMLYAAPVLTFKKVIGNGSTEEFSCIPYIIAFFNCLLYTLYGSPVVSIGWENFPIITVNALGIILEFSFILTYFWFTSTNRKKLVLLMLVTVAVVFCTTASVSTLVFDDHRHRKALVGCIGLVSTVAMYASPLIAMRRVIETESVEFMPFHLSLFSFMTSSLWMTYGLLGRDLFLASPNLLGSPLCFLQLVLYCRYRKKSESWPQDDLTIKLTFS